MIEAIFEDIAVSGDGNHFLVLLKSQQGDILPISIGHLEAMSIAAGRAKEDLQRPMSHDLMLSMLQMLDATINRIEITDLQDNVFYAKLVLNNRGIEIDIDARPSDALALAVRVEAPIWIEDKVLEAAALSDFDEGSGSAKA